MTKDTGDFTIFLTVACREYTLPRDDGSSQPRGWIQGNTRVGLVLEVTASYLFGKHGIEIRIWSVSQDNSHSWVRIFHGSNKFVVDSNNNNRAVPADLLEEQTSQSSVKNLAARSKAKAKPQKRWLCMQCISEWFVRAVLNVGCYGSLGVFWICSLRVAPPSLFSSVAIWSSRVFRRLCFGYLCHFLFH